MTSKITSVSLPVAVAGPTFEQFGPNPCTLRPPTYINAVIPIDLVQIAISYPDLNWNDIMKRATTVAKMGGYLPNPLFPEG